MLCPSRLSGMSPFSCVQVATSPDTDTCHESLNHPEENPQPPISKHNGTAGEHHHGVSVASSWRVATASVRPCHQTQYPSMCHTVHFLRSNNYLQVTIPRCRKGQPWHVQSRAASASSEAFQLRPSRLVTWSRQLPRVAEPAAAGAVTAMSESATMVCESATFRRNA